MNKTSRRPLRTLGSAATALFVAGLLAACGGQAAVETTTQPAVTVPSDAASSSPSPSGSASPSDGAETLNYAGRTGATALELLLEADPSAEVTGEGENAFVTAIGGRVADESKSEFWSLSVDGEPAQVGAGTLETEDGQEITWTIETF